MNFIRFSLIFIFIMMPASCSRQEPSAEVRNNSSDKKPLEVFSERISPVMALLCRLDVTIDTDLYIETWKTQNKYGQGMESFVEYVGRNGAGDFSSDDRREFTNALIEGGWKDQFEKSIVNGIFYYQTTKMIINLSKSLQIDNPDLSKKLIEHVFTQTELVKEQALRAAIRISYEGDFHEAGFDGMSERLVSDVDLLLNSSPESMKNLTSSKILSAIAKAASVDIDQALKLKGQFVKDPFFEIEADGAMGAGMMGSDYEKGKQLFIKAINDFEPSKMNKDSNLHTVFEYGYTRLKEEDRKAVFDKLADIFWAYKRIYLLPPPQPGVMALFEPELPAWYREALFKWMEKTFKPKERATRMIEAMSQHATRFPRSNYTEEFIGWVFEWIAEVEKPYDRYMLLGQLSVAPNVVIPERVGKSLPRIMQLAQGLDKAVESMDSIYDYTLGILLLKNPLKIKNRIGNESDMAKNDQLIMGIFALMRGRHYFYPDSDGGMADYMDKVLNEWDGGNISKPLDRKAMLAELWSGWDDDKAWNYVQQMSESEGEYPRYLVNTINVTKVYDPGFATRCYEELLDNYRKNTFKKTNPTMEEKLVYELARSSIQWSEELADVIVEKRGNKPPVFAYYSLYNEIVSSSVYRGADKRDINELALKIQERLKSDLDSFSESEEKEK